MARISASGWSSMRRSSSCCGSSAAQWWQFTPSYSCPLVSACNPASDLIMVMLVTILFIYTHNYYVGIYHVPVCDISIIL